MGRVGFALNNAREHYEPRGDVRHQRQPDADDHRAAGRRRPVRAAEHGQRGRQRLHQRAVAVQRERHVSGAARHRRSPPTCSAGRAIRSRCSGRRRSAPTPASRCWSRRAIDTFRYDNVWDTDLRVARTFRLRAISVRVIGDVFNVINANTVLIRNNNCSSTAFNTIGRT